MASQQSGERDGATARPWRCERYGLSYAVVHEGGRVAYAYAVSDGKAVEEAKANAELIVTAVNDHSQLVEKVRALRDEIEKTLPNVGTNYDEIARDSLDSYQCGRRAMARQIIFKIDRLLRALGDGRE